MLFKKNTSNEKIKRMKPQPIKPYDTIHILIKQKGLVIGEMKTYIYKEPKQTEDGKTEFRDYIILNDKKKKYKLYVNTGAGYSMKGIETATIFVENLKYEDMPYKQLSLEEMDMEDEDQKPPPINEDMGKVLSKIYQDNLNAKAKPQSLTAGLTKGLFYVFVFSIAVYAVMFSINIIMEGMAISAFHSASGLISTYITHTSYHIAPVTNSTANTIANATKP